MKFGNIHVYDIANGAGVRVSLFVSGCRNRCKNCFQPETWSFDYGSEFTDETMNTLMSALTPNYIEGLSVLGGDPMEPENQSKVAEICATVREKFGDSKNIWVYTGYMYEDVKDSKILDYADVLIDGKFEEANKCLGQFRGSTNQRIIDVKKTREAGKVVLYK